MKFTLSWLEEYLETSATVAEIAETLTMIGLEVKSVQAADPALNNFTVVHILSVESHPHADPFLVCQVETGSELIQVICSESNVRAGMKSLLARPGVIMPLSGKRWRQESIRGIESQGMLCSAWELQIGDDSGVLELPTDAPIGAKALEVLTLDPVLDIGITPNRADCLGVQGIARELAAAGLGVLRITRPLPVPGTYTSPLTVTRAAEGACPIFVGRFIRDVRNRKSPRWLRRRLRAVGLPSVSTLVDITNLLSLDAARPLHVFDADKITGTLKVRFAQAGETLAALDNKTYSLQRDMLIIADDVGPQALAGLIGGTSVACSESTTNVFLESALFDPVRIARAGRILAIESESRHRFERGVDPAAVTAGAERATRLILNLCGGEASALIISGAEPAWQKTLYLRPELFRSLTGFNLPVSVMQHFLDAVGCTVVVGENDVLTVTPPSWRSDLSTEHNLVEEIVRLHGYDSIPIEQLRLNSVPVPAHVLFPVQKVRSQIRRALAARGMLETLTWSFISSTNAALFNDGNVSALTLANPMSADLDTLRPSLLPNLIRAASRNAAHGMPDSAFFEIGPQFYGDKPGEQKLITAGIRTGYVETRNWNSSSPRMVDIFDAKSDAMAVLVIAGVPVAALQIGSIGVPTWYHPGRSGTLQSGPTVLGWFGEIHPHVVRALNAPGLLVGFEIVLDALPGIRSSWGRSPLKVPHFHPVLRDFAFVMDNAVPAEAVLQAARSVDETLIVAVQVFDVYRGLEANRKSLAISVTLQPTERTLTDQDIESISSRLIKAVCKATGATLRGPSRVS
ncbi:Phenylalanyl-tRNA synthetase beta chain [invertebrate metagenome]|uniref:Phenylalanine--tRNA ligase beta subunit n=1 Tax=invertebrate metagenome TaxID=1711999 RepID=A0A484H648_9ZZZZ